MPLPAAWTVLGAPTSAGAFAPGQEKAPAALRAAGLLDRLAAAGLDVRDGGDSPVVRWRPDRANPTAQHVPEVAAQARALATRVAAALAGACPEERRGRRPLVLGGDCTLALGAVAGHLRHLAEHDGDGRLGPTGRLGLVYLDMHPDLNVPASVPDGALDWMGLAHLLGEPGALPELVALGPRAPMLAPADVALLAHEPSQLTDHETARLAALGLSAVPAADVRADPAAAARAALAHLSAVDRLHVHLDVDVVDFVDCPLSENDGRNVGLPLDAALAALAELARDPRLAGLTVTELNPDHGAPGGSDLRRFVDGLASALSPGDG